MPRSVVLGSERIRRTATIEAAGLALARGPADLEEALGYLSEARASPAAGDRDLVLGMLALTLDRAGRREQARAVAREASGPYDLENLLSPVERARVASPEAPLPAGGAAVFGRGRPLLPDGELHAVIATLAEGRDAALRQSAPRRVPREPARQGSVCRLRAASARGRKGHEVSRRFRALLVGAAVALGAAPAFAQPTLWQRVERPRARAEAKLLASLERMLDDANRGAMVEIGLDRELARGAVVMIELTRD